MNVGGKLYVVAAYTCALVVLVLRVGPRLYFQDDTSSYFDDYDDVGGDDESDWDSMQDDVSEIEDEQFHQEAATYGAVATKNSKGEIEMLVPLNDMEDDGLDTDIKSKKEKVSKKKSTFHG